MGRGCWGWPRSCPVLPCFAGACVDPDADGGGLCRFGRFVWLADHGGGAGGALAGDQVGFGIGRIGGEPLMARIGRDAKAGKLVGRATAQMDRYGAAGVFLTRWLFPVPGPFVNFVAGATGFSRAKFTIWGGLVNWSASAFILPSAMALPTTFRR